MKSSLSKRLWIIIIAYGNPVAELIGHDYFSANKGKIHYSKFFYIYIS